jgi:hypothetical protein
MIDDKSATEQEDKLRELILNAQASSPLRCFLIGHHFGSAQKSNRFGFR